MENAISLSDTTISVPNPQRADQRFKFKYTYQIDTTFSWADLDLLRSLDGCYGPESSQDDIFVAVRPM